MQKVVAFDLDGTLSESDRFLVPAYREALQRMGKVPPPDAIIRQIIGGTAADNKELIFPGCPWEEYEMHQKLVKELNGKYMALYGRAYPQIRESLLALRERGYHTALCSNGSERYARQVLEIFDLQEGIEEIFSGRPGWNKVDLLGYLLQTTGAEAAVMVGDRHFDLEAARGNGIPFIGCRYGLFPQEVATADRVVDCPEEIPQAVADLIG